MNVFDLLGLKSKNPDTRRETAENIARNDDPAVLKHLYPLLADPDVEVRRATVKGIATFKWPDSVPALKECFNDADKQVRTLALGALGKIGDGAAREALIKALRHPDFGVRQKAAATLETCGWSPSNAEERALKALAAGNFLEAASEGSAAVELLADALDSDSVSTRLKVIEILAGIEDQRVFRMIGGALKDKDASVRVAAVAALQKFRDIRAFDPLLASLKDTDHRVRQIAVESLGFLGDARAVAPLMSLVKDPSLDVRIAAASNLGRFADTRACEVLVAAMEDREADVRLAAAKSLAKAGDAHAIPILVASLKDESNLVRTAAASALHAIDSKWQETAEAQTALPELETALHDREYWVRQAAAKAMTELHVPVPSAPSLQLAGATSSETSGGGSIVIEPLLAELNDADPATRYRAVIELRKVQHPRAVPGLVHKLYDEDDAVRKATAEALEVFEWNPTDPAQRVLQYILLQRWNDIVPFGEAAVLPLLDALKNSDPLGKKCAAQTLGKLRDNRAVEPLLKALEATDFGVRKAAVEALGEIGDPRALEGLLNAQSDRFKPVRDAAEKAITKLGTA